MEINTGDLITFSHFASRLSGYEVRSDSDISVELHKVFGDMEPEVITLTKNSGRHCGSDPLLIRGEFQVTNELISKSGLRLSDIVSDGVNSQLSIHGCHGQMFWVYAMIRKKFVTHIKWTTDRERVASLYWFYLDKLKEEGWTLWPQL